MKNRWKRLVSAFLALALVPALALPALGAETAEDPQAGEGQAALLDVTAGSYTPPITVQPGQLYTLIALPYADDPPEVLTAGDLVAASGSALFIGSATADAQGRLTFSDVRLRTAQAAVYYVTGPGLTPPYREATGVSTGAEGVVKTASLDSSASITLVDKETDYRYNTGVYADQSGYYTTGHLAPGKYKLRVEKPGYLPYLSARETDYLDVTSGEVTYQNVDISANVGDVTGDGSRDMADLAALLTYYDGVAPQGVTADLDCSGAVDAQDAALLAGHLNTGAQANVTDAVITVQDEGGADAAELRRLSFELDTAATVSGAAFSLTFQTHAVQLLTPQGGLMAPVDGGTLASCLLPADGFTAQLISWKIEGEQTTLSFAVTADTPQAAGQVARLYYRPATGSTESFYTGVFALTHAAALVGKDTVVTQSTLTYPGCDELLLDSITIDQASEPVSLTIPFAGRTAVLPLSATGKNGATTYSDLSGVDWQVTRTDGKSLDGISVTRGLLTLTSSAAAGEVQVTASLGDLTSEPLTVTLENAPPVATSLSILKDGAPITDDTVARETGSMTSPAQGVSYTAAVYDQYGELLAQQPQVTWSLLNAPAGVYIEDGAVYCGYDIYPTGQFQISVVAEADGLQAVMALDLTLLPSYREYVVAGPLQLAIPAEGEEPISYRYVILGQDEVGGFVTLSPDEVPSFGPTGDSLSGVAVQQEMDGSYTVTVSSNATPSRATFAVGDARASTSCSLLLYLRQTDNDGVRAAVFYDGQAIQTGQLSLPAGTAATIPFTAKMLDRDGAVAATQPQEWEWSSRSLAQGALTLDEKGLLTVAETLAPGTYSILLSVKDPAFQGSEPTGLGWAVEVPVTLEITPSLDRLELSAPESLTIPTAQDLQYTLVVSGQDADGNHADLPDDLVWTVTKKGSADAPSAVSVTGGVLTISPAAAPGTITVTVASADGTVSASADITLAPAGGSQVLTLYRQIVIDGKTVQKSAPVLAAGDTVHIKEGQSAVITYTAMLVDQTTNEALPIVEDKVKWVGSQSTFTVDGKAQPGTYSTAPIAVYENQSATAAAQVTVYPDIQDLRLDFGDGFALEPPYTLGVPAGTPKTYVATVMATILRDGQGVQLPLSELGLTDYTLEATCAYTGVYITPDTAAGTLRFTVDPVAIQNSMDAPAEGEADQRVLSVTLGYFPGESLTPDPFPFFLVKEALVPQDALLRRGVGVSTQFVFDTPKADDITIPAGSLSNCYALELLDQYNRPLTGQGDVTWTLTGAPRDEAGNFLVTLLDPGQTVEDTYPNYSSIRRLRISGGTPAGTYSLTLSAACGDFTRSLSITLTVTPADAQGCAPALSPGGQLTIPRYYYQYNATTPNEEINTFPFTLSLPVGGDRELDPLSYAISWSVTDPTGAVPAGVSISAGKENPATAEVSADRTAKPTGAELEALLRVTATVKDSGGGAVGSATATLELARGASVPTVMEICKNGQAVSRDNITLTSTDTTTRDYTFALWDQYGQQAALSDRQQVTWRISSTSGTGVTAKIVRDTNNVASVRVTIAQPSASVTINLSAVITVDDPKATGGQQLVYATIPLNITVNSSSSGGSTSSGGSGGGGGAGGTTTDTTDTTVTAGPPASLTIVGTPTLTTAQGTAATRTFSATLRDASGVTCASSYNAYVTWSATGLSGGLTFNTATHVLTVPSTAPAGTYTCIITATYTYGSTTFRQPVTVTVTVTAKLDDGTTAAPTDVTLAPTVTQTGVTGAAALTTAQEQALLATSGVSGGTVTIVPSGGSGLTTLSVSLTAATANAIASQRNQSLRVQTTLGTVVLSPEALRALAARGGSDVTVTLSTASGVLKVDLSCGSSAASLPGSIILNAYATGNVALQVNTNGSETLLKKALVEEGKIYTYLTGSAQLKTETRASGFTDTQGHWAKDSIDFTVARSLFQGTSATTFDPGGNMTRSMVVTVLHRLEDTPAAASTASFADVAQNSWYTDAVSWANASGIVQGTDSGFKPGDPVTREQLATILYRYVGAMGLSTSQRSSLSGFSDQSKVSTWARDAMEWAVAAGLINGKTGGVLDPGGYASRAEVSAILERLIRYMVPVV